MRPSTLRLRALRSARCPGAVEWWASRYFHAASMERGSSVVSWRAAASLWFLMTDILKSYPVKKL